jgi:phosphoglycerate dehydrogenase-like enzyme
MRRDPTNTPLDRLGSYHMKIVVIGGTGLIGSKLVALLRQRGQDVLAASPASGVNTLTGEGLAKALAGAQVVVRGLWLTSVVLAEFLLLRLPPDRWIGS